MDINKVLNNVENLYYGHGTGNINNEVIQLIMNNGLCCSHGSLYFTSVKLGRGSNIVESP